MTTRSSTVLLLLAYVGFVSLGLPDGLLGVASPSMRASFGLAPEDIGELLVSFTAGYLLSSFNGGSLVSRLGVGTLLALSALATSVSLLGYALTSSWRAMLGFAVLSGLGAGTIDAGLNTWVATHFTARTVNWLHGFYGVGAAAGPLVMTAVLASGRPWRAGYAIVGLGQLALAATFAATRRRWEAMQVLRTTADGAAPDPAVAARPTETLRLPATWLGIAVFFLYTGTEATAGVWAYSVLTQARGVDTETAGLWVSLFWTGLTVGRFAFGAVADHVPVLALLRASMVAVAVGAALFTMGGGGITASVGLVASGFGMAPIFPSLIATTPARLGARHTGNAVGFQVGAAILGAALLPSLTGLLVGDFGLEVVGPSMLAAALALLALHEVLARSPRQPAA
jgi:fucose permease